MDAQRVPRHQFRSDRQGAQAPWATSLKYRGNTLRIHPPFHHSIGSSGAVFSNGQSGVNYPTEKAPADAIGWGIKALTSQSVTPRSDWSQVVRLLSRIQTSYYHTPIQTGKIADLGERLRE